jgi:N-acyl-D-aspartate/D-glutamate deacylase
MIHRLVLLGLLLAASLMAQDFDTLIRNGRIIDGTGNPSFHGDIGIKDGNIAAMGHLAGRTASRTIDAGGLAVTPGFIDMHNHSDRTIEVDGDAQSMIHQGVTSMILGEGSSPAPNDKYPRFSDYWAVLLKQGISTNIGSYIGSGLIFETTHGSTPGPATPAEVDKMRTLVREAMEDGALGVSTSLHQPPGFWISTGELVEMAKVAAEYGGIYSSHTRGEGTEVFESISEAIDVGRQSGTLVDLLHLKIAHQKLWGQMPELIGVIQNARNEGLDIEAHIYPYIAGQNALISIIPPWAREGGREEMIKRLQDPSLRERLERDIVNGIDGWYGHYDAIGGDWSRMQISALQNPAYQKYVGKRMNEVIADMGKPPFDVLFELLINDGRVPTVYFHHTEEDMTYAMKQPFVSFGSDGTAVKTEGPLSDGKPHPRYYGTFPRIMGRYVREQKVIPLEEAVRKATSHNAAKIRIYDRGILRPGMKADIAVFDPETIIDKADFDNPHQYAEGVEYVIVNGKVVLDQGEHTGARPGTILYGPGKKN